MKTVAPEDVENLPRLGKHLLDMLPIDEIVDEGLEILLPPIAIIDVIGMLPHIAAEDRIGALHQRVFPIGCLGNAELAVLCRDPAPARAELRHAGLHEIIAHLVIAAEIAVDSALQRPGQLLPAAALLHPFPEVD